ncbi:transglycosylase SLT domain-containing protein, partial [Xanthomonas citri pv. citri]|nr:transglycosylase SLT domain-containing protein [Xanthomonas citri pv. citri]
GGWNFSLGIAQVNRHNLPKYKLTYAQAFDACANLRAGSKILQDCYARASAKLASEKDPLHAAFSCYYSGNFSRGFRPDKAGQPSYVQKVLASAGVVPKAIPVVPAIGARTSPTAHLPAAEPAQPGDATAAVPLTAAPAPSEP